jgi:hypothetical protein
MKTYTGKLTNLEPNQIFVFGSNPQGRHGAGAAAVAKQLFGAKSGQGRGLMGQSYGIVTKDLNKRRHPSVSTRDIKREIDELYEFAKDSPELEFFIAYAGKGALLSGFSPKQMASMFARKEIPGNIVFEEEFYNLIKSI